MYTRVPVHSVHPKVHSVQVGQSNPRPSTRDGQIPEDKLDRVTRLLQKCTFLVHGSMHIRDPTRSDVLHMVQPEDWVHCGRRNAYGLVRVIFKITGINSNVRRGLMRPFRTWVVVHVVEEKNGSEWQINCAPLVHGEGVQRTTAMPLRFMQRLTVVEVWEIDALTGPHPIEETWGYDTKALYDNNMPARKDIVCFLNKWRL